jgi:cell wall-associated NlpC family hydrolase
MRWWLGLVLLSVPLATGFLSGCATQRGDGAGPRGDVVLAGLSQVGTPYVYGGTNPG